MTIIDYSIRHFIKKPLLCNIYNPLSIFAIYYLNNKAITNNMQASSKNTSTIVQKETRVAVLFIHTIAEKMGLQLADIRCLDYLMEVESATAGDIAKVTDLTTGAVTAMIDRLEKIKLVQRSADTKDRRKIIITLYNKNFHKSNIATNFFTKNVTGLLDTYTKKEQKIIIDWNVKMTTLFQDEIKKLNNTKSK